jgi:phosphatidylinositol glycan class W
VLFPQLYKAPTSAEERQRSRDATSSVLFAFNRNGLAVFLVANLLTGAVNMSVPTLHVGVGQAMAVLGTYTAAVAGVAVGLDRWDVSVKL